MPVSAGAVGTKLNEQQLEVSKRRVLAFSAVIGDTADAVFDDARPDGIVALPQYCVSLEWPMASAPETAAALGLVAGEAKAVIHLRQDSEFHSEIRPGDRLTLSTTLTGVRSTARGAVVRSRAETINNATGAKVVTSRSDALFVGVSVDGNDASVEAPDGQEAEDLPSSAARIDVHIARALPHLYTECAQIWNPIHTERAAALAAGLPDIILHGTATWALAGQEIAKCYADGNARRLRRLAGEFSAMVIPGKDIVIEHAPSATDPRVVRFVVRNHEGALAIENGLVEIRND